jgi:hypothetical protein
MTLHPLNSRHARAERALAAQSANRASPVALFTFTVDGYSKYEKTMT